MRNNTPERPELEKWLKQWQPYGPSGILDLIRYALALEERTLEAERHWQPIETAPKGDTKVDLWLSSPDGVEQWRETDCWWNADRKLWCNLHGMWDCATHWMPKPKAPDAARKGATE